MDRLHFGPETANHSDGHNSETDQGKKILNFSYSELDRLTPSCQFVGQNSEYPLRKNSGTFSICQKNVKNRHLTAQQIANR